VGGEVGEEEGIGKGDWEDRRGARRTKVEGVDGQKGKNGGRKTEKRE